MKTIREVADLAGVTIRTLRHYDKVGLLKPLDRSASSGIRLYGRDELLRLREILVWRQLGFALADIAALIDQPRHDRAEALRKQFELATEQLGKFQVITRGLERAIAAMHHGCSPTEDNVFAGFASSLGDDDSSVERTSIEPRGDSPESHKDWRRIPTFALLGGRARPAAAAAGGARTRPRVVGTDPIRIAESLLALGVMPIGAGTYEDRFTEAPGVWPWPSSVEQVIRDRIRDVGYYGSDAALVEAAQPDLIIDLASWSGEPNESLSYKVSGGRYGYDTFASIAPTTLLAYRPDGTPAFLRHLTNVADVLGLGSRVQPLLSAWRSRTLALGPHLAGREVAVVGSWGSGDYFETDAGPYFAPTSEFGAQVFTSIGVGFNQIPGGEPWTNGWGVSFDEGGLTHLDAPVLFFHSRHLPEAEVAGLFGSGPLSGLPAVQRRRVYWLGWDFVNGGWFNAHAQLFLIAKVFGVAPLRADIRTDLRAEVGAATVYAAASADGGLLTVASPRSGTLTVSGPAMDPVSFEVQADECATVTLDRDVIGHLSRIPEAYRVTWDGLSTSHGLGTGQRLGTGQFDHDRESALQRVSQFSDNTQEKDAPI